MIRGLLIMVLIFNSCYLSFAQIDFQDNSQLLSFTSTSSFAMGMCDIDGDFRDDISLIPRGADLRVYLQNAGDQNWNSLLKTNAYPLDLPWTFCAGDLNNDGFKEILIAGRDNGLYIYDLSKSDPLVQFINDQFFSQATNFVDINNDGWLDLMACNDLGDNYIYINDQTGQLVFQDNLIDWTTQPASDNSGNYSSEWIDFDNDNDLDLSIVKCKEDALSMLDPRRINMLFRNDGNGNFSNVAASTNFDVPSQSWSHNWGDVDNDGDLDCYVINHDLSHTILVNDGTGNFVRNQDILGGPFIGSGAIQSIFYDLDNDTDLDVLVTGARDHILWNNGAGVFTDEDSPFEIDDVFSASIGDINQDGFADILATNNGAIINIGTISDYLFSGVPNANNYFKLSLEGTVSNRDAIGATVYLNGPWGTMRRDLRAGESYSIVNSSNLHFGLANHTQITSLEIIWPSGISEVYTDLEANEQYLAIESHCINKFEGVTQVGTLECVGDEVGLSVPDLGTVTWSTGETGTEITVSSPGSYSAEIDLGGSCRTFSKMIYVDGPPTLELPNITTDKGFAFCEGRSLELSIADYDNILWSNGSSQNVIAIDTPGWYGVTVSLDNCPQQLMDSTYVEWIEHPEPDYLGDTLDMAGNVSIFAYADSIHWYETSGSTDIIHIGSNFQNFEEKSRKYYAEAIYYEPYPGLSFDLPPPVDDGASNVNDGLFFTVLQDCSLSSVSVMTDVAGPRTIELRDDTGTVLQARTIEVPISIDYFLLPLDFDLTVGVNYLLTTNTNDNVQNLGTTSPQFRIRPYPIDPYPFIIPEYLYISGTKDNLETLPYFFEWQIHQGFISCQSGRVGVPIVIDGVSKIETERIADLKLTPNPISKNVYLQHIDTRKIYCRIHSLYGEEVFIKETRTNSWLDLAFLSAGVYVLSYSLDNQASWQSEKLIKL